MRLLITGGMLIGMLWAIGLGAEVAAPEPEKETVVAKVKAPPAAGAEQVLTVTVVSVSGTAEVREKADKPWRAVKAGDNYQEGTQIRTGFGGQVKLAFADNSQITVGRVSHFRVDKFRRSGQKVVTRSHLSYGTIKAGVEKGPAFSDYKITTPLGTLGVNGTRIIGLTIDPGSGTGNISLSNQGNVGWNTGSGSDTNVDPGGSTDQGGSGQDQTGNKKNNVNLVDPFGSTNTEDKIGNKYGNQGDNNQTGTSGKKTTASQTFPHHYLINGTN